MAGNHITAIYNAVSRCSLYLLIARTVAMAAFDHPPRGPAHALCQAQGALFGVTECSFGAPRSAMLADYLHAHNGGSRSLLVTTSSDISGCGSKSYAVWPPSGGQTDLCPPVGATGLLRR